MADAARQAGRDQDMASLMGGIPEVRELLSERGDEAGRCALDFLLFRDIVQDHTAELQQARGLGLGLDHTAELQQAATWYGMVWYGVVWYGLCRITPSVARLTPGERGPVRHGRLRGQRAGRGGPRGPRLPGEGPGRGPRRAAGASGHRGYRAAGRWRARARGGGGGHARGPSDRHRASRRPQGGRRQRRSRRRRRRWARGARGRGLRSRPAPSAAGRHRAAGLRGSDQGAPRHSP